ncbi:hypothetical protein L596_009491 [Steinernema carpocapsae]|uniref:Uncharacterized protein n=1 Tax=Steinernema carpocapsae TaxID=34508 RepID=A0A4U5PFI2_STECR|nr:hypothetical protein L596_009491 [Steinernema carpocapsae]
MADDYNMTIETLARRQANDVTEMCITGDDVINPNEQTIATTVAYQEPKKKQKRIEADSDESDVIRHARGNGPPTVKEADEKKAPSVALFMILAIVIMLICDSVIVIMIGVREKWKLV